MFWHTFLKMFKGRCPSWVYFFLHFCYLVGVPRDCIYDRFHPAETSSYTSRSLRPEKNGMEGLIQRCAARRTQWQWQKYKPNRIPVTSKKRHFFWEGAEKCLVNFTFNCWEEVHSDSKGVRRAVINMRFTLACTSKSIRLMYLVTFRMFFIELVDFVTRHTTPWNPRENPHLFRSAWVFVASFDASQKRYVVKVDERWDPWWDPRDENYCNS